MKQKKDMLNKYRDMYADIITKMCNLHNAHVAYVNRPNRVTTKKLKFAINDLKRLSIPTRRILDDIQKILIEEKKIQVETNKQARAEASARYQARKLKRMEKNGHNQQTNSSNV